MTTARPRSWRTRTAAGRPPFRVSQPFQVSQPFRESQPVDRGTFADFAAGRTDRLGRDLLVQIARGPVPASRRLANALLVAAPVDPGALVASVAWIRPDTVWIHASELIDAYRAARILEARRREIVVIEDDLSAAEELGLVPPDGQPS